MLRLATACLLFVAINFAFKNAHAQENLTNLNPLRLEFSFSQTTADAKQGDNKIRTKSSNRFGTVTYYFKRQFFGEVGYGRPRTHNILINDQSLTGRENENTELSLYGLGFRSYRKGSHGEYLGLGIRFTSDLSAESDNNSTQIIRLFTQKDTRDRYGAIQLSRQNGDAGEITKLGGRHIWFGSSGVGFGFEWAFGIGRDVNEAGLETNYRSRDVGVVIMYRPKLMNSGHQIEPENNSEENPFDEAVDEDYVDSSEDPICDIEENPFCESEEILFGDDSDENPFDETTEALDSTDDVNPFADTTEAPESTDDVNPYADTTEALESTDDVNPFADTTEALESTDDVNPFADTTEAPESTDDVNPFADTTEAPDLGDDENPFCDTDNDPFCESSN